MFNCRAAIYLHQGVRVRYAGISGWDREGAASRMGNETRTCRTRGRYKQTAIKLMEMHIPYRSDMRAIPTIINAGVEVLISARVSVRHCFSLSVL